MSVQTPRYIIESHGSNPDTLKLAFAGAFTLCQKNSISSITLLVCAKNAFPDRMVGEVLGEKNSRALLNRKSVKVNGVSIDLKLQKTFSSHSNYGVIIGIHLAKDGQGIMDSAVSAAKADVENAAKDAKVSVYNAAVQVGKGSVEEF